MFVKELKMYLDYLNNEINRISDEITAAQIKKWQTFKNNLLAGIEYYQELFASDTSFPNIQNLLYFYKTELLETKIPEMELV